MCSFLFSSKRCSGLDVDSVNHYLKFRGPDLTTVREINDCLFIHNLLSITGELTTQPFVHNDIVLVYNGEIYNYEKFGSYESDGACIIPLYEEYGYDFVKKLDGEFAICLVDFKKGVVLISGDVFKTKPLFIGRDGNDIGCSSYKTPLEKLGYKNIVKAEPNKTRVFSLETGDQIHESLIFDFCLKQHKDSYDDWIDAFFHSINKRTVNTTKNMFMGLSSGYDSGIIFSVLNKLSKNFTSITLRGSENDGVINERLKLKRVGTRSVSIHKDRECYNESHNLIANNTEAFNYTIHSTKTGYNEYNTLLINDDGSNNFATVCRAAKQMDCKICLSGTGADEIISDYGFAGRQIYNHSNFGGLFPKNLQDIFPWASFYGSTLESYIAKEEYVGGSFGIEMRYPFLDTRVVQEFLWLSQDLKNKEYKAPIDYYFRSNNYPYARQEKRGF